MLHFVYTDNTQMSQHKNHPREVITVATKTQVAPASDSQAQRALFQTLVKTYPIRYHRSDTPPKPRFADNEEGQKHLALLWRQKVLRIIEKNASKAGVPFSVEKVITQNPYDYLIFEKVLMYTLQNRC